MATTDKNKITEAAHIRNVRQYNDAVRDLTDKQIDNLIDQGSLQSSSVFENALAQSSQGKYSVISKNTHDFTDYSDGKTITSRLRSSYGAYSAPIKKFKTKIGPLRVQCWERILNKFYYFYIPHEVYSRAENIEIPFNRDGTPTRQNNSTINWWDYEVATFEELATTMIDPVSKRAQDNMKHFTSLFSMSTHSGGRQKGTLSMTPNAIRKRAARAAKREAFEATKSRSAIV